MDKGFYLYCIRAKSESKFSTEGIGGGKIFAIPHQDLEAVVSEVSLEEFGSEEIQKKAQEDLNWIKEKALVHEKAIEDVMGLYPRKSALRAKRAPIRVNQRGITAVIPMKFGTIFKNKESLKNCLENQYQQFKNSLDKLKGKQEWGVKVYLKEDIFKKNLEEKNEIILAKKKKIELMPKGIAFFAQKQIDEIVGQEKDKELNRTTEEIYENLGQSVFSKNKDKLLEKDFTGRPEEMVLNAFYLIEESKLDSFQKKVGESKEKYNSQGLEIELSGPWPSYHFA